ncbi:hypothetical protein FE782_19215 [Paenibacillus antri]|uniref:Periplasmic heavy metal sensor n=1 Tax=Paenibacillus antri TaxID=2582848 RepID=A0A5R9G412_9BACL|nr:hypothetical protein [Paenibacillus antri]TLS50501.1 hypothetical protein FE782_19215 [Paenibacillus antri]
MRWFVPITIAIAVTVLGAGTAAAEHREDGKAHHQRRPSAHVMAAPSHQAMYMQLLAEKYAPETAAAWKQTMAERVALMNELQELKKAGKWKREDAKAKMERMAEEKGEAMKEHVALVEQFTQAVQAEDAKAIKAVLPKLLASEQKLNETLRQWVESARQAKSS